MKKIIVTLGLLMSLLVGTTGWAAPLNLNLNAEPDIFSSFITVDYLAGSGVLTASGFANNLLTGGALNPIAGGSFDLSASIDNTGVLSGGTLAIGGTIAGLGFNSGTLLTGNLTAFGFDALGGDPLEFLFTATSGDALGLYSGLGGIILSGTGFGGSFNSDFASAAFSAMADVGVVPVPAAVWLFGSALLGLIGYNRRRKTG